jgi:hypothetical protein
MMAAGEDHMSGEVRMPVGRMCLKQLLLLVVVFVLLLLLLLLLLLPRWDKTRLLLDPRAPLVAGRRNWAQREDREEFQTNVRPLQQQQQKQLYIVTVTAVRLQQLGVQQQQQ